MVNASPVLVSSFVALAVLVASAFVAAVLYSGRRSSPSLVRRDVTIASGATVAWLALTFTLAATGRLSFTSTPPTVAIVMLSGVALAVWIGTSRFGLRLATGIPLAALIGAQAFRFPLELMLHRAYVEGLMPVQMSYSGFNFDILSGLFAIVVALQLARRPSSLVAARMWNVGGVVLLANILTIAVLSTPTRLRVFMNEPANSWIAHAPWVWLPTVFVVAAIVGHILVFRRLRFEAQIRAVEPAARSSVTRAAVL